VREVIHQGQPGVVSSALIHQLPLGASIRARIKSNTNFHLKPNSTRLILIGNGTGLAGLRSHLKARITQGNQRNWLIFGERNQAHDNYYSEELSAWQKQGWITQLDLVFSRDAASQHTYVQHRLLFHAKQVREWIKDGATIMVCGSLYGMGSDVDNVLREILGSAQLEQLVEQRRYLRDVY
jgi:sulfite reductase (NADPH) flavoprotein alpha-component